ncbi:hypothetical protein KR018_002147 [Drosophila ironensis]|nr:hypothetical protein KR018_002147 [Drosophila ironensis]
MPSVKSAESEILLGIIRSDSKNFRCSMTNGKSLRSCLLLCTVLGLFCRTGEALPFEYLDEHDDFNYDLDTAQSQAKYDARLLSQQMLSEAELQRQRSQDMPDDVLDPDSTRAQGMSSASGMDPAGLAEEDLEPHSRAAACFTNGHKYTHGQKVPRSDACEVCLCMDGEIFCWWEKCDKANVNRARATTEAAEMSESHSIYAGDGAREDAGNSDGDGDYSDPYRHESTTGKSTKVHKMARKLGKRHKHRKNQKNFNDYEVYHSHRQKQKQQQQQQQQEQQQPDYKKSAIKQQEHQLPHQLKQKQKHKSDDDGGNYNIIKQHKHEQQQQQEKPKLTEKQHQNVETLAVNHAAKATHYQQPVAGTATVTSLPPHPTAQQHPHQTSHSSSKILNFPENLPAVLYYDYKTEEHEHHQHQHHQQHLLHEKQRLLQQQQHQEALARQKAAAESGAAAGGAGGAGEAAGAGNQADAGVELSADVGADKNFDEAETDSDILPEPPTKRPKAGPTQWPAGSSASSRTTTKALMTTQPGIASMPAASAPAEAQAPAPAKATSTASASASATTATTATSTRTNEMVTSTLSGLEKTGATVALPNTGQLQHDRGEELDDAFHRWLTSTELNADNTNTLYDNLEQEVPTSTIIDDVGAANKSDSISISSSSISNAIDSSNTNSNSSNSGGGAKDNGNGNGIADAVFFRSSYNDYSSEFNGSVVNIDITLTAVDVHPRRQTDLIANGNRTSGVSAAGNGNSNSNGNGSSSIDSAAAGTTMDPQATGSLRVDRPPQSSVVLPSTMTTTIITTTPMAPGRMCNVLGKLYKIGDILPQDTGNCLQCICTDAVTPDEMPSVTCSPHNCPPLVLPDLFDATGY